MFTAALLPPPVSRPWPSLMWITELSLPWSPTLGCNLSSASCHPRGKASSPWLNSLPSSQLPCYPARGSVDPDQTVVLFSVPYPLAMPLPGAHFYSFFTSTPIPLELFVWVSFTVCRILPFPLILPSCVCLGVHEFSALKDRALSSWYSHVFPLLRAAARPVSTTWSQYFLKELSSEYFHTHSSVWINLNNWRGFRETWAVGVFLGD